MNEDKLRDLAALHALGLLEGDEKESFENELRSNPRAAEILVAYQETSDLLALTTEQHDPPASLEAKIFSELPEQNSRLSGSNADDERLETVFRKPSVLARLIPWGIAASFAALSLFLTKELSDRDERIHDLVQKRDLDELRIAVLKSQLDEAPNAEAVAVWSSDRRKGRLTFTNLPPAPEGKQYQLWLIDSNSAGPVSAGVFDASTDGTGQYAFSNNTQLEKVDTFALSVEDRGGKPSPEGPIILVSR